MFKEESVSELKKLKRHQLLRSIIILMLLIGTIEMLVMFVIHPLGVSDVVEGIIDAVLLVTILTPFIYYLFIRQAVSDTEHSLFESLQLSDDLVKAMPAGIYIYAYHEPDSLILIDGNQAAESMTGKIVEEWRGKPFDDIWPAAKTLGITDKFLAVAQTGVPFEEENLVYSDGKLSVDTMVNVFLLPNKLLAVSFIDITERKRIELALQQSNDEIQELAKNLEVRVEDRTRSLKTVNAQMLIEIEERKVVEERLAQLNKELELLSYQDGLTGVANRRLFDELLNKEWRRCQRNQQPISIVMFDIDYFKQYNDCYGHQLGDYCLQNVAKALAVISQRPADLLARYGGE